jgi:hypothetical protein
MSRTPTRFLEVVMSFQKVFSMLVALLWFGAMVWATPVENTGAAANECEAANGITPYCSFNGPEDIALISGTHLLIVSEIGGVDRKQGRRDLLLFDTDSKKQYLLYPKESEAAQKNKQTTWGARTCAPLSYFSPGGIGIGRRPNGELELFVVNHGDTDSVQMFSAVARSKDTTLKWRGCVEVKGATA